MNLGMISFYFNTDGKLLQWCLAYMIMMINICETTAIHCQDYPLSTIHPSPNVPVSLEIISATEVVPKRTTCYFVFFCLMSEF